MRSPWPLLSSPSEPSRPAPSRAPLTLPGRLPPRASPAQQPGTSVASQILGVEVAEPKLANCSLLLLHELKLLSMSAKGASSKPPAGAAAAPNGTRFNHSVFYAYPTALIALATLLLPT